MGVVSMGSSGGNGNDEDDVIKSCKTARPSGGMNSGFAVPGPAAPGAVLTARVKGKGVTCWTPP